MKTIIYAIIGYIFLQFIISIVVSRQIKTEKDFLIAGKKLNFPLTTFSLFGTWFGAETCIGVAGAAYAGGLAQTAFEPFSFALSLLLMSFAFSKIIWKMNITTVGDFFRNRFSPHAEKIVAFIIIPTSIFWAAAQFKAFGQILIIATGVESQEALFIASMIIISYATIGGLLADAYSDLVQGCILIIGIGMVGISILNHMGDLPTLIHNIPAYKLNYFYDEHTHKISFNGILKSLNNLFLVIFGAVISQELVARVLAAKSPKIAKRATISAALMYVSIGVIPLIIGLLAANMALEGLSDPDQILPFLAQKYMSPAMFILFIISLIAAILSTVNSALLSASALLCHNLIIHTFSKKLNDKTCLLIERLGVVIVGFVAYNLAFMADNVYYLVLRAEEFGSAGVFVCFIFGLLTKIGNGTVACLTLIIGLISSLLLQYLIHYELSFLLALLISFSVYISGSLFFYIKQKYFMVCLQK